MTPIQQQAQRLSARTEANKQQQNRQAEKTREENTRREPARRQPAPSAPPEAQTGGKAARHNAESYERSRRLPGRERAVSSDTPATKRTTPDEPAAQEASLFSQLLGEAEPSPLPTGAAYFDWASGNPSIAAQAAESAPPAMAVWQQLEPSITDALAKQPRGPLSMTLLLPKLGEVDARMANLPTGAGWDISLRFAPQALAMIAPHHERCRESLRRRMACRVRLRFEQRGGEEA